MAKQDQTKVISVDTAVKAIAGLLLTILTGLVGWLLITVVDNVQKITRVEAIVDAHERSSRDIIVLLRDIDKKQNMMIETQVRTDTEIQHIKEKVR